MVASVIESDQDNQYSNLNKFLKSQVRNSMPKDYIQNQFDNFGRPLTVAGSKTRDVIDILKL